MDSNSEKMKNALKKARKDNNYTQEKLASKLGVGTQTVSNWEQGNAKPKWDMIFKLKELYSCEIGYLTGETDGKTYKNDFIMRETGLSESAVETLRSINNRTQKGIYAHRHRFFINLISYMLTEGVNNYKNVADRLLSFKQALDQYNLLSKVEKVAFKEAYQYALSEVTLEYPDGEAYDYARDQFRGFIIKQVASDKSLYDAMLSPIAEKVFDVAENGDVVLYKDLSPVDLADIYLEEISAFSLMFHISDERKDLMDVLNSRDILAVAANFLTFTT